MLSSTEFIRQSLELHLFFARIMKEHSFFLEVGFTQKDSKLIHQADIFRMEFDCLLSEVISLSDGIVSNNVLQSGEVITPYTLKAERASAYFTGVNIQTEITRSEEGLSGNSKITTAHALEQRVFMLNQRAMGLVANLAQFKSMLLSDVLACRIFTVNYPLLIDHILREARFYLYLLQKLQNHQEMDLEREAYEQESFWNRIMAEHSKFIRGLLDPTEEELINTANNFGKEFDKLTKESKAAMDKTIPVSNVTKDCLKATTEIRKFKEAGTKGILECKIKSILIPLLGDHTLREANHYLRLLKIFTKNA